MEKLIYFVVNPRKAKEQGVHYEDDNYCLAYFALACILHFLFPFLNTSTGRPWAMDVLYAIVATIGPIIFTRSVLRFLLAPITNGQIMMSLCCYQVIANILLFLLKFFLDTPFLLACCACSISAIFLARFLAHYFSVMWSDSIFAALICGGIAIPFFWVVLK